MTRTPWLLVGSAAAGAVLMAGVKIGLVQMTALVVPVAARSLAVAGALVAVAVAFVLLWIWHTYCVIDAYWAYWHRLAEAAATAPERQTTHADGHHVEKGDFEDSLEQVQREIDNNGGAMFGHVDGVSYRLARLSIIMLGGGRAVLLQLAHPFVALGIELHSNLRRYGPEQRFYRTFEYMFAMQFGTSAEAIRAARRVRVLHERVHGTFPEDIGAFRKGDPYNAHWDEALLWVLSTLIDSGELVHAMLVHEVDPIMQEEAYESYKRLGLCFGLPREIFPPNYHAFKKYVHDMMASDVITVGASARATERFLLKPPSIFAAPALLWADLTTAAMLPPRLRAQYGKTFGPFQKFVFFSTFGLVRLLYRLTPEPLWYFKEYVDLEKRSGKNNGRLLTRLSSVLGTLAVSMTLAPTAASSMRKED